MEDNSKSCLPTEELEGLIKLAEESASNIDNLVNLRDKLRQKQALTIGLILLCGLLAMAGTKSDRYDNNTTFLHLSSDLSVFIYIALFITSAMLMYLLYIQEVRVISIRRTLRVEGDIHYKIIELIDTQYDRAKSNMEFTPVQEATIAMRVRRLYRSNSFM